MEKTALLFYMAGSLCFLAGSLTLAERPALSVLLGTELERMTMDILDRLRSADEHSMQRAMGSRIFGEAADEIERLRRALMDCDHQTDSMRVWGGLEWKYHPPQAGKIHSIARAALDAEPNAEVTGAPPTGHGDRDAD